MTRFLYKIQMIMSWWIFSSLEASYIYVLAAGSGWLPLFVHVNIYIRTNERKKGLEYWASTGTSWPEETDARDELSHPISERWSRWCEGNSFLLQGWRRLWGYSWCVWTSSASWHYYTPPCSRSRRDWYVLCLSQWIHMFLLTSLLLRLFSSHLITSHLVIPSFFTLL